MATSPAADDSPRNGEVKLENASEADDSPRTGEVKLEKASEADVFPRIGEVKPEETNEVADILLSPPATLPISTAL